MAQGENEPGVKGAVQLLSATANANLSDKVAAALARAGYRVDRGPVEPAQMDAVVVLWTPAALNDPALIDAARKAFEARRLTPISIGGVEPPFGSADMEPMNLAGWRGEDADPRWRFVLSDIEALKTRAELEPADGPPAVSAPAVPGPAPSRPAAPAEAPPATLAATRPPSRPAAPKRASREAEAVNDLFTDETAAPHHPARALWRKRVLPAAPMFAGAAVILGLAAAASYFAGSVSLKDIPFLSGRERVPVQESAARNDAPTDDAQANEGPAKERSSAAEDEEPPARANLGLVRLVPGETPGGAPPVSVPMPVGDPPAEQTPADEPPSEPFDNAPSEDSPDEAIAGVDFSGPQAPQIKPPAREDAAPAPDEIAAEEAGLEPEAEGLNQAARDALASAAPEGGRQRYRGDFFTDCEGCPDMAALDGGVFLMGARPGEQGAQPEEAPQRRVEIGYRFAIATRETTFDQWMLCVSEGSCRGHFPYDEDWGRGQRPAINVSYEDAASYARWLSAKTGRHYRLPSEAEWEFAARAGTGGAFFFGDRLSTDMANFDGRRPYGAEGGLFRERTVPVTSFPHNAFGLFDMHGNVAEWTLDCWAPGHDGAPSTGAARIDGDCSRRVVKGGAWDSPGADLRSAHRRGLDAETRAAGVGFRVVRVLD